MQKTQNFQLNQWEKTDRIMMEDFNSDNARLEAALNAIWETFPLVKLVSLTLPTETTHTELDLSSIDLTDYRLLQLYVRFPSGTIPSYYLALQVNDLSNGYINRTMATASAEIHVGQYLSCSNRTPIPTNQVKSFKLTGVLSMTALSDPSLIPAGTKITLYGLKG